MNHNSNLDTANVRWSQGRQGRCQLGKRKGRRQQGGQHVPEAA